MGGRPSLPAHHVEHRARHRPGPRRDHRERTAFASRHHRDTVPAIYDDGSRQRADDGHAMATRAAPGKTLRVAKELQSIEGTAGTRDRTY
jgi:hypothetical protein